MPPRKKLKPNTAGSTAAAPEVPLAAPAPPAPPAPAPAPSNKSQGSSASVAVSKPISRKPVAVMDATAAIETWNADVAAARELKRQTRGSGGGGSGSGGNPTPRSTDLFQTPRSAAAAGSGGGGGTAAAPAVSESERFRVTAKQIKELGATQLTGRHKRSYEREKVISMGGAAARNQRVPMKIGSGIWKANNARDDHKRERDRAMGLSVAPKRKRIAPGTAKRDDGLRVTPSGTNGSFKAGVLNVSNRHIKNVRAEQSQAQQSKSLGKFMRKR